MSMCDVVYELVAVCLIFLVLIINGDGINKKKQKTHKLFLWLIILYECFDV